MFIYPFTFARRELSLTDAKYAILGVPYDSSESYRSGARFAPNAIREASREIEDYDFEEKYDLQDIKICDIGDVEVAFGNFDETLMRTKASVKEILKKNVIPVCIGGEHTISYCAVKAYQKKPFCVVFDAHLDFRDEYLNEKFSHACTVRRIGELVGYDNVLVIGIRNASKEEYTDAKELGLKFITSAECEKTKKLSSAVLKEINGKDVYLSIDMDVLDPKEARGVCNPEPLGLSYQDLLRNLEFLKDVNLAGLDLVEVTPLYDNYTPILAAKVIFKILVKNESFKR